MLCCRCSFDTYAKNVQEKANNFSLKSTEVLLDADGHGSPKFDICQGTVAQNSSKSYASS